MTEHVLRRHGPPKPGRSRYFHGECLMRPSMAGELHRVADHPTVARCRLSKRWTCRHETARSMISRLRKLRQQRIEKYAVATAEIGNGTRPIVAELFAQQFDLAAKFCRRMILFVESRILLFYQILEFHRGGFVTIDSDISPEIRRNSRTNKLIGSRLRVNPGKTLAAKSIVRPTMRRLAGTLALCFVCDCIHSEHRGTAAAQLRSSANCCDAGRQAFAPAAPIAHASSSIPATGYPWPVWTPDLVAVPPSTTGKTYYVDTSAGKDSNAGTSTS
ncbi:hypothetical protein, partial [Rudaea sp.]|uniref:hypothetical protein n=1 Tax=Rudaea sp. TaxID=2136325 RepID=UPI0032203010